MYVRSSISAETEVRQNYLAITNLQWTRHQRQTWLRILVVWGWNLLAEWDGWETICMDLRTR